MKKTIALVVSVVVLMCVFAFSASAASTENSVSQISLHAFSDVCSAKEQVKSEHTEMSKEDMISVLNRYAMTGNDAYMEQLNNAGYYLYNDDVENQVSPISAPTDIELYDMIVRDEGDDTWLVVFFGHWKNLSAISSDNTRWFNPQEGDHHNIGGLDMVGFRFYNVTGPTPNIKKAYARIEANSYDCDETQILTNPCILDEREGIAYQYQDYLVCTKRHSPFTYDWAYMGRSFDVVAEFDDSFEEFHGQVRGVYAHSWNDSSVTSVGLSTSGFSIGWSTTSHHFEMYSAYPKVF